MLQTKCFLAFPVCQLESAGAFERLQISGERSLWEERPSLHSCLPRGEEGAELCSPTTPGWALLGERSSGSSVIEHKEKEGFWECWQPWRVRREKRRRIASWVQGRKPRSKTSMSSTWTFCSGFLRETFFISNQRKANLIMVSLFLQGSKHIFSTVCGVGCLIHCK